MPDIKLDHCVIAVSDWERSNAFYRDVVGAELVALDRGCFAYRLGDQQLNVHGPGATPSPRARQPVEPGNSDLCFVWPGPIAEAAAHLERAGVEVEEGPVARTGARGPATSVYFRDPDGSLLEFMSYDDAGAEGGGAAGLLLAAIGTWSISGCGRPPGLGAAAIPGPTFGPYIGPKCTLAANGPPASTFGPYDGPKCSPTSPELAACGHRA